MSGGNVLAGSGGYGGGAPVAEWMRRLPSKQGDAGSIPVGGATSVAVGGATGVEGAALIDQFAHPTEPPNDEIARAFLQWQQGRKRRPITLYQYAARLDEYLAWIAPHPLGTITLGTIETFLARPQRGEHGPRAASTIAKECSIIRGLYRFALGRGLIDSDPTVLLMAPPVRRDNPRPIPDDVWTPLWACERLPAEARVILGLGYLVGLRRAEITRLSARHVDVRNCRISGLERKGGADDVIDYGELVAIAEDCFPQLLPGGANTFLVPLADLVRSARSRSTLVDWPTPTPTRRSQLTIPYGEVDPQLIYRRLRGWLTVAGLPEDAFVPHQLRHSFVTNLLRHAEMPIDLVRTVANHSSIATTMAYRKVGGQELRDFRRRRNERSLRGGFDRWSE